jgi:hypothetical protein
MSWDILTCFAKPTAIRDNRLTVDKVVVARLAIKLKQTLIMAITGRALANFSQREIAIAQDKM